ncbi:hypothetical protein AXF42_Ash005507 [Apostasia shenzhenica]|uniref:Uncharacterized protein n=1 Tax=Apostasia shenzhenica TaxID=1088818 RepID=A0A2I0B755_9ASPA|nr:hypothetical protein AXF42_Ash005507 [Apostasia shenzhenica]
MANAAKHPLQKPPGYRDPAAPPLAVPKPPPKKAQLPPAFRYPGKPTRQHRIRRSCSRRICCGCCFAFLAIVFLLAVAGGVSYLWFRPMLPSFRVENVTAPVFNLSSRSDGTFLDASAIVKIHASNPNGKLGLSYREATARVAAADEDGDVEVGTGSAPGFELGRRNSTVIWFAAAAKGLMVDDAVGGRLKSRFKNSEIRFVVEIRTKVGYVINGKSTVKLPIRVKCSAVSLKQIGSGRSLPKCNLDFLNGIF